jgi:predicted PurR-regulated permease PerM
MEHRPRDWQALLVRLQVALYMLLLVIATLVILYVIIAILGKFYQTIFLFVIGAIFAYLLIPVVNLTQRMLRKRWAAILSVYLGVFLVIGILGVLLLNPFVAQAQSLAANLQHPSKASLKDVKALASRASQIHSDVEGESNAFSKGTNPPAAEILRTRAEIAALEQSLATLKNPPNTSRAATPLSSGVPPPAQTRVPNSYLAQVDDATAKLAQDYAAAASATGIISSAQLKAAIADARSVETAASDTYQKMSSTPLLLLDLQHWLDDHGFKVDINQRFGSAASQLNNQAASLVNNAANIVLTAGTLMVNTLLMLIISVYFLSDGPRLVRKATQIGPAAYRASAPFYVRSLDQVLGGYIRGQIVLAAIAAVLGAGGAWVLGVPYPELIGLSTFFLILIPVIGSVILVIPPVLIALIFTPLLTAVWLLIYYLIMMQIVTNIIGPRVVGHAVGIHPLEAMAAALVGFPIAGFLGSFFAVPIVGFFHIAIRQAYHDFGQREMAELEAAFAGRDGDTSPPEASTTMAVSPGPADPVSTEPSPSKP